ncbi:hypothetical protein [Rugamonas aquatica]|uniref:Lipoprotein n=1 Tax=Rugamonas aquatica TaxID=2743357 RepID=A0A6A7MX61_9BURK|nr:hypothetical protein [Rugamonas aquatica]MQA37331.1 hypothetical protein [Rugamonas aquatica]
MNKKLIGSAAVPAAILGLLACLGGCREKPAPAAPTPRVAAASQLPVGVHAPQPEGGSDGEEVEITQTLKGKDFTLEVYASGSDPVRNLMISMTESSEIRLFRSDSGQTSELGSMLFAPADTFELKELIPGEPRQQILCKGKQLLSRGAGTLGSYSLYRIEGDHLQELLSLIVERVVEEGNGYQPQTLHATVEETTRDGQPLIVYRVKAGKLAERTIEFRWNGKLFEDASGEYAKLTAAYNP